MLHAIDLCENAQRLTLLACCEMLLGRLEDALRDMPNVRTLLAACADSDDLCAA